MKKFKFTLESVLLVRKHTLEDERIKLASIMNVYNKQQDVLRQMKDALNQVRAESERYLGGNFDANIIANYAAFSNKIAQDIKTQEKIIEKTFQELKLQQQIAKEAYIKVKSLENLKEKQKEEYNKELLREEIKQIDDIVNSKRITA